MAPTTGVALETAKGAPKPVVGEQPATAKLPVSGPTSAPPWGANAAIGAACGGRGRGIGGAGITPAGGIVLTGTPVATPYACVLCCKEREASHSNVVESSWLPGNGAVPWWLGCMVELHRGGGGDRSVRAHVVSVRACRRRQPPPRPPARPPSHLRSAHASPGEARSRGGRRSRQRRHGEARDRATLRGHARRDVRMVGGGGSHVPAQTTATRGSEESAHEEEPRRHVPATWCRVTQARGHGCGIRPRLPPRALPPKPTGRQSRPSNPELRTADSRAPRAREVSAGATGRPRPRTTAGHRGPPPLFPARAGVGARSAPERERPTRGRPSTRGVPGATGGRDRARRRVTEAPRRAKRPAPRATPPADDRGRARASTPVASTGRVARDPPVRGR